MKCQKCLADVPEVLASKVEAGDAIHCPYCTAKLEVQEPLLDVDPNGLWKVETQAIFHGKGRRTIGLYKGELADVIAHCGPKAEHSLYIRKVKPVDLTNRDIEKPEGPVSVHLEARGGEGNEHLLRSYLSGHPVSVDSTHVEWVK